MHEHAIKIPISKIYEIFEKSEYIKEIIDTGITNATDFGNAHELFLQLNKIADALSSKSISISDDLVVFKRISISPMGQYQAWLIMDKIIIISENAAWLVLHDPLFYEGELMIRNPTWDENECILTFTLFYPVHDKYKLCKTCFSARKEGTDQVDEILKNLSNKAHPENHKSHSLLNLRMAYSEICAILDILDYSMVSKIPREVKVFFKDECMKEYIPHVDANRPLSEQNLNRKTLALLSLLYVNYWCDSEKERESYLRQLAKNSNIEFDANDRSWDLSFIFPEGKETTPSEVNNYVIIQMPFGDYHLYAGNNYFALMKMFTNCMDDESNAIEFYLPENVANFIGIKNLGLVNVRVLHRDSTLTSLEVGSHMLLSYSDKIVDLERNIIVNFIFPDEIDAGEWDDSDW